jgi:membrane-bound lytic murein transglycosylase A
MALATTYRQAGRIVLCLLAIVLLLSGCGTPAVRPAGSAYVKASWSDLPTVSDADLVAGFRAWRAGCTKLRGNAAWKDPCASAAQTPVAPASIRSFLQTHFDIYALDAGDTRDGLITGYFEPVYPGSLSRTAQATVPVYAPPGDLITVALDDLYPQLKGLRLRGRVVGKKLVPYDDAATIEKNGVKAPVLAWLTDPMDLQFLQIQGSGRVQLSDGRQLRLGYADQNGQRYRAIGKWLIEQNELPPGGVNMQSIRAWASAHPNRVAELLASNPSYVFFQRLPDSNEGPTGSFGLPMTAGYSVAVDRKVIPLGSLLWLSTSTPDGAPLVRPVAAHDTGGAIAGKVRADLFTGTGSEAGELAGRMQQQGRLWLLWPRGQALSTE